MNWATTIDLNPVALSPSASIPHIPYTERNDTLKIYGEDDVTVSDANAKVAPAGFGILATAGAFWTVYTTLVSLGLSATTNWPLYPATLIPETRNGVSTSNPATLSETVAVTVVVAVTPSPDLIDVIPTASPVEPTIRYSSILGWISTPVEG